MSQPEQPVTDVSGAGTAAPTVDEMAQNLAAENIPAMLSDFEKKLAQMMADAEKGFAAQQATLDAQRAQLAGQIAAVRQQTGPPQAVVLAESLAQRVKSIAAANPDIHPVHFVGVTGQADRLNDAVKAAADGSGAVAEAERLANAVTQWFTRSHPRASSKFLEGAHEALSEAERILEALPELAPAAEAIASAV
jgi:hypothetical protein